MTREKTYSKEMIFMTDKSKSLPLSGRALAQAKATEMGIDEALISRIVDTFYRDVQNDKVIGPVFNNAIGDSWDPHLAKMKDFWSSIVLYSGRYHGKPMPIHRKLEEARPEHFGVWLRLFRHTLEEVSPSKQVVEHFMEKAESIARSLQAGMFPPTSSAE